jgi:hypothetical protein
MENDEISDDEISDGQRDVAALLLGKVDGDDRAVSQILAAAGERGLVVIAMMLLDVSYDALLRVRYLAEAEHIVAPELGELPGVPGLRDALRNSLISHRDGLIREAGGIA